MKFFYFFIFLTINSFAQTFQETQILYNPDLPGDGDNHYGWSISSSGNYTITSAKFSDITGFQNAGAAYIYEKDNNDQYSLVKKLLPNDDRHHSGFGVSTAMSGDYAAVGDSRGNTYIYRRNSTGNWVLHQQLPRYGGATVGTGGIYLSHRYQEYIAMSDNWLVIGHYSDPSVATYRSGSAHIYKKNLAGNWVYFQKIVPSTPSVKGNFGTNISVSGTNIMVRDHTGAYVYQTNSAGNWVETQKINIDVSLTGNNGGYPVKIFGNTAVIGKRELDSGASNQNGIAYVYTLNNLGTWVNTQNLVAFDNAGQDEPYFGLSIDVSDNYILVGPYVFSKSINGIWVAKQKLISQENTPDIGTANAVTIAGNQFLIAQAKYYPNVYNVRSGKVSVFGAGDVECDLVVIPDPNFEQALLDLNIDTDGVLNGSICREDALPVTTLYIANQNISDLTGIEAFINLETLHCSYNNITVLNLQNNTSLLALQAQSCLLTTVNITNSPDIKFVSLSINNLSDLDISNNLQLEILDIGENQFSNLDVTQHTELKFLVIQDNNISSINLVNNLELENLHIGENQFTEINLETNTALKQFFCGVNQLTVLDVSNNTMLETLNCPNNLIQTLDLSANQALQHMTCNDNELEYLNLKNNANVNLDFMFATNNNNLSCIQVDNVTFSNNNVSWFKDTTAIYNIICPSSRLSPGPVPRTFCGIIKNSITMSWGSVPNVQGYQVEITSNIFRRIITRNIPVNQTSLTIRQMGDMSWRVRPVFEGQGVWSDWIRDCNGRAILIPDFADFVSAKIAKEETLESDFNVYPNPLQNGDVLYITNGHKVQNIHLYNLSGHLIFQSNNGVNKIDMANFKAGVYLLKLQTDSAIITKNIVIK